MDPELFKVLAPQGIFASLFGFLGHRQLKQSDRLQEQNDKLTAQLIDLSRGNQELMRSNMELNRLWLEQSKSAMVRDEKIITVLDRVSQRLDK